LALAVLLKVEILLLALVEILYFLTLHLQAVVARDVMLILKTAVQVVLEVAVAADFLEVLAHQDKVLLVELLFDKMVFIQLVLVVAAQVK
jgi:hypothetical protein